MTGCDDIRAAAAGLAALPPGDREREAAYAHARGCAGCARALRQAEALQTLLAEASPEPLSGPALARVDGILRRVRREEARRSAWAAAAVGLAPVALVALARRRTASGDWLVAPALAALAVVLAAVARRRPGLAAAGAVAGAVVAAGIAGRGGPLEAGLGFHCLALELACAAGAVAAGWAAVRRGVTALGGRLAAGAAAAGALAGDAGLHLVCRAQDSLPHLLVFHVGGVALVAVLAARLVRGLAPAE